MQSQIQKHHPDVRTAAITLDLSSQCSIRTAAKEITALTPSLDILINNAGVMHPTRHFTADGVEMLFGTNHIGPFLLTNLLMPLLRQAAAKSQNGSVRIVNLTSQGHRISPIRFSDYNFDKQPAQLPESERPAPNLPPSFLDFNEGTGYTGFLAYGQSKTANILFTRSLNSKFSSKEVGIQSFAVHPGSIVTDLSRHLDEELTKVIEKTGGYWKTQDEGTSTTLVAAFDPGLDAGWVDGLGAKEGGCYLGDCQVIPAAAHAEDDAAAERLWGLSEDLVGENFAL